MILNNLTPAPLFVGTNGNDIYVLDNCITTDSEGRVARFFKRDDAEFYVLANAAFDVMRRREWGVAFAGHGPMMKPMFVAVDSDGRPVNGSMLYGNPFTAVVEADKWYVANVEDKP